MKALILAAGKGTRLLPLTEDKPKALVEINGITLLERSINKLKGFGIKDIIVNTHYLAHQIHEFIKANNAFDINIGLSNEDELLDTGGAIKKAAWFFDDNEPFLVYNTDIISDIDLDIMKDIHTKSNALATLAVRKRETSRYLLFDSEKQVKGWENVKTGEKITKGENIEKLAFSGIHILDPKIFKLFPTEEKFSIITSYLDLCDKFVIQGFDHTESKWYDVGKFEEIANIEKELNR